MDDYAFVEITTSTNIEMAKLLKNPIKEGFIIQSNFQKNGRGQAGNYWESEAGKNLTFSMVLYPEFLPPVKQFLLSKMVAVALLTELNKMQEGFEIKWPNDIYFKNKKVAGILIETAIMGTQLKHAIIGVGLNVNQVYFDKAPNPTSLKLIIVEELNLQVVLASIKKTICSVYDVLKHGGADQINEEYAKHLYRKTGMWKFEDVNGIFKATIQHVKENGQLVLSDADDTTREYWMKEVKFLP